MLLIRNFEKYTDYSTVALVQGGGMSALEQLISQAKGEIQEAIHGYHGNAQTIIGRYTAAIAVNFTDWIGKSIPWVRHETAYHALVDNLRCEASQDHVGMLLRFASLSDASPDRGAYIHTYDEVAAIRKLFAEPVTARPSLASHFARPLRACRRSSSPDLALRAKQCGCTDFTYTDIHGEADAAHSGAFVNATEAERTMGYRDPDHFIARAIEFDQLPPSSREFYSDQC